MAYTTLSSSWAVAIKIRTSLNAYVKGLMITGYNNLNQYRLISIGIPHIGIGRIGIGNGKNDSW